MEHLEGRTAVVTGAASGIGLAIVEAFVGEGMRVVMADVDSQELDSQVARLLDEDAEVHGIGVDVSDPEQVGRLGDATVDRYGALHVAVNNAGVVNRGYSWELPLEEWRRVIDVDLWGVIHGVRSFVPRILASGQGGHLVNMASMAAVRPLRKLGPYSVAKHGVLALSDVVRAELRALGAPVGVSVVMPGAIRTRMNSIGTIAPATVAANVIDAIRKDRHYVFTDADSSTEVETRLQSILAARGDVRS